MSVIDLVSVKTKLEASGKNFASISKELTSLNSGSVPSLVPEVRLLIDALPLAIASISRATASIGTNILGLSGASSPTMVKLVGTLVPDVSEVKALSSAALIKSRSTPGFSNPALEASCARAVTESNNVSSIASSTTSSISAQNQVGPKPVAQMISEINSVAKTLADYSNSLGSSLFTGSVTPSILDTLATMKTDQLLEYAVANKDSAVDFSAGAVSSTVYKAAAISREVNLRYSSKAAIYSSAVGELSVQTSQANSTAGISVANLSGTTPKQNIGI